MAIITSSSVRRERPQLPTTANQRRQGDDLKFGCMMCALGIAAVGLVVGLLYGFISLLTNLSDSDIYQESGGIILNSVSVSMLNHTDADWKVRFGVNGSNNCNISYGNISSWFQSDNDTQMTAIKPGEKTYPMEASFAWKSFNGRPVPFEVIIRTEARWTDWLLWRNKVQSLLRECSQS